MTCTEVGTWSILGGDHHDAPAVHPRRTLIHVAEISAPSDFEVHRKPPSSTSQETTKVFPLLSFRKRASLDELHKTTIWYESQSDLHSDNKRIVTMTASGRLYINFEHAPSPTTLLLGNVPP